MSERNAAQAEAVADDIVAARDIIEAATVDALKRKMEVDMRKLIAGMKISVDGKMEGLSLARIG